MISNSMLQASLIQVLLATHKRLYDKRNDNLDWLTCLYREAGTSCFLRCFS